MHVLGRAPDLHLAAIAAAVLATVLTLTLAIAGGLIDLSSAPQAAGVPAEHGAVPTPTIRPQISGPFTHGPFTSPFTAPVRLPWVLGPR